MKQILLITLIIIQFSLLLAVFDDYQPSARARGMGNAYVSVTDDTDAIFYNPAGLALTPTGIEAGYSNLANQSFTEFKALGLNVKLPKKIGSFALGARMLDVDFEDDNLMSEQIFSAAHSFTLMSDIHSSLHIGYTGNYYKLSFADMGNDDAFGIDLGLIAILHQRTRLGFAVTNVNSVKMGINNEIDLPRKLAFGISYIPYDNVITSLEMKKDFAQDTEFMGGVEYRLLEPFALRAGVHQNPASWTAGASFYLDDISIDYSYSSHSVLDGTHYMNIGYHFKGGK